MPYKVQNYKSIIVLSSFSVARFFKIIYQISMFSAINGFRKNSISTNWLV